MNKAFIILLTLAFIGNVKAQTLSDDNLLVCMPMNGNAIDMTNHGFNGAVHGATLTSDRNGMANNAYSFDGVNDYIEIENIDSSLSTSDITISMWAKSETSKLQCLFMLYPDNVNNRFLGILDYSHNGNNSIIWDHGNINTEGRLFFDYPLITTWNHYVYVVDSKNSKMAVYKNGVIIGSKNNYAPFTHNNRSLIIGGKEEQNKNPFYYKGEIDDIRIYNSALNDSEIMDLYNGVVSCNMETTGIAEKTDIFKNIYPNPGNGIFNIDIQNEQSKYVEVNNLLGEKVFSGYISNALDISSEKPGIYFLTFFENDVPVKKTKIIIE